MQPNAGFRMAEARAPQQGPAQLHLGDQHPFKLALRLKAGHELADR